ncbi:hypothetical protein [Streptomyces sp. BRA346]|uniref:hypothetical protein n=1 Tax=Streptomyces sp. BRA346 TaxID=2878199 RepID=UPI004062EC0A
MERQPSSSVNTAPATRPAPKLTAPTEAYTPSARLRAGPGLDYEAMALPGPGALYLVTYTAPEGSPGQGARNLLEALDQGVG